MYIGTQWGEGVSVSSSDGTYLCVKFDDYCIAIVGTHPSAWILNKFESNPSFFHYPRHLNTGTVLPQCFIFIINTHWQVIIFFYRFAVPEESSNTCETLMNDAVVCGVAFCYFRMLR